MHDLDCFGDVETIPVALLECFRARDLTDEFLEADLTIGEAGFGRAVLFSCIAAIANDLGINSADHCLDSVGSCIDLWAPAVIGRGGHRDNPGANLAGLG